MKAIIMFLTAVLFSSISLFAQQRGAIVYNNTDKTESLTTKEYIAVDKNTLAPFSKTAYVSDADGNKIERTVYKWSDLGWVAQQKMEYKYTADNQISSLTYTAWDAKTNTWSDNSKYTAYSYNNNGEWLASYEVQIKDSEAKMISQN